MNPPAAIFAGWICMAGEMIFCSSGTTCRGLRFPIQLLGTTFRGVIFGFKVGRPLRMIHGLFLGYAAMLHEWSSKTTCIDQDISAHAPNEKTSRLAIGN